MCSHLLPPALKQYLGLLPNFEQRETLAVYGRERMLQEAGAALSARTGPEEKKSPKLLNTPFLRLLPFVPDTKTNELIHVSL